MISITKRPQKKLLRAATVKARVNVIHTGGSREEPSRYSPYYDVVVLTLCISGFDVHRVLIDPGSATDLFQLPAFNQTKLSSGMLNLVGRILSGFNSATTMTLGDVTQHVLYLAVEDLGPYNAIVDWT